MTRSPLGACLALSLFACSGGTDDSTTQPTPTSGTPVSGTPTGSPTGPTTGTPTGSTTPSTWPLALGRWGTPTDTLTLPDVPDGEGLYYPDLQASFPDVDWATLDRLYIPAGSYSFLNLGNLPDRDPADPLVITNLGGQVHVGSHDHHYLFVIGGGSGWVLTGRPDPDSATGDPGFPGHWEGAYANSAGTYGILVDDAFVRDSVSGIAVGGGATAFEIEFVEVTRVGFAGMLIKTDNDASATMKDVVIHDTYVHDTLSEGFYIGSTQAQPQHLIVGLELHNNRVLRTGTEAIQVGQTGGGIRLHHNVFGPSAVHWKDAFQPFQDGNLQLGVRTGTVEVDHNLFLGAAGSMIGVFPSDVAGDTWPAAWEVSVHDNHLAHTRERFVYLQNTGLPGLTHRYAANSFRARDFQRDELDPANTPGNELIRTFTPDSLVIEDNHWDATVDLSNPLPDGNGTNGNASGSGNVAGPVEPVAFRDAGLADDFDLLKIEVWTAVAGLGDGSPVTYELGDIALVDGQPWECTLATCAAGNAPPDTPSEWAALPPFPDDVRVVPGTAYDGLGLAY